MSDHVDGPRSIGDPAADISDLFAFTSPENPARTVLAMCVFPSAGEDAMFSNVDRPRDRRSPRDRCRRRQRREVSAGGRRDPLQLPVRRLAARCRGECDPARRLHTAGRSQAVAHGERREGSVDTGRRFPRVRRAAFRSVLPRLDRLSAHEGSQSAAARQRALHRRRVRHAPRARSREGLVVRRDRRDRPDPATARPHRTSSPHASTGSDAPSRRTYGSTIPGCQG